MSSEKISRRTLLQLGLGATTGAVASQAFGSAAEAPACGSATPEQVMGPFYPQGDQADKDLDLTLVRGHGERAAGEVIYVRGRVLDEACNPVPGAVVEIWQASSRGRYSHERDPNPTPVDPHFQGRGQMVTDQEGRYGFKTIKPGAYPLRFLNGSPDDEAGWRTPHIHFRLARRGFHEMVTQMYFPGEALNEKDGQLLSVSEAERPRLIGVAQTAGAGDEAGAAVYGFDITLRRVSPAVVVAPETLQEYVGTYNLDWPGGPATMVVSRDGNRLLAGLPPIIPDVEMRPLAESRFSLAAIAAEVAFVRNAGGRVDGVQLHSAQRGIIGGKRAP
jgi:protocatechuate 3,4-dioxygenase beta subunit